MPRLTPLPVNALASVFGSVDVAMSSTEPPLTKLGFIPNSLLILARRPEIVRGLLELGRAILGPSCSISAQLANLIAQMASQAAGCSYCWAHTAYGSGEAGVAVEKETALWEYETSPLFTSAERAALRVAQLAAQVPNAVTDAEFDELRRYYSDTQIVDIVSVIALYGFMNRYNDTMATELEASPTEAGKRFLAQKGWAAGKHGAETKRA